MKKLTDYEKGILTACAILQELHDQPRMAADIIKHAGLSYANCSKLNPLTKLYLKYIQEQEDTHMGGLNL